MQQKQGHPVVEVLAVGARRNSMLELDGAVVRGGDKTQKRLGTYGKLKKKKEKLKIFLNKIIKHKRKKKLEFFCSYFSLGKHN